MTVLLGEYALSGAMLTALAMVMAAFAYWQLHNDGLLRAMRWGMALLAGLLCVSAWALLQALVQDNFALSYVMEHSERALPLGYKLAAFWAGQQGSLLFWAWVLGLMGAFVAWRMRQHDDRATAVTLAVLAAVTGFFTCIMLFATDAAGQAVGNPFELSPRPLPDGMGLNPQLQNLAMVAHPPLLFLGYAGFTVPFALLMGALAEGATKVRLRPSGGRTTPPTLPESGPVVLEYSAHSRSAALDERWLELARPWMVFSWITLTVGIVLGAQWAYMELGWGGYWAWDPVENASLFPWLTGTALLHNAILQTKRGIFRRWTAWMTVSSFLLCIVGTYLTRSGVIQSVHAFERSSIGTFFLLFMGVVAGTSVVLILLRLKALEAEYTLEDFFSQEGFFLLANVLLTIMTVTTLFGTLYPLISGLFGDSVTVKGDFYNYVILPMALLLVAVMSTGPVLGSGQGALVRAGPKLAAMLISAACVAGITMVLGFASLWALGAAAVVGAVVAGVGIDVVASLRGNSVMRALLIRPRHWGAQVAHLGMAAIVAGVVGSSLGGQSQTVTLHVGQQNKNARLGNYALELSDLKEVPRNNYSALVATVTLKSDRESFQLQPELRKYERGMNPDQTYSKVALRPGILSDVYMTLVGVDEDGSVGIKALINPLVNWIWIGGGLLAIGGLICMLPSGRSNVPVPASEIPPPPIVPAGQSKRERQRALSRSNPTSTERR